MGKDRPLFRAGELQDQSRDYPAQPIDYEWSELLESMGREEDIAAQLQDSKARRKVFSAGGVSMPGMTQPIGQRVSDDEVSKLETSAARAKSNRLGQEIDVEMQRDIADFPAGSMEQQSVDPSVGPPVTGPPDLGIPLGAGQGARPGMGNYMSELDEKASAFGAAGERAKMMAVGHRTKAAQVAREMAMKMSMDQEAMDSIRQNGIDGARNHMKQLAEAYDRADLDVASLRVNPQRWEESTPALAQVLMALASSAFSFFNGGKGVNPIIQLVQAAIDRDVDAQKTNIANQIRSSGMGIEKETVLANAEATMNAAIWERAHNSLNTMMEQGNLLASAEEQGALAAAVLGASRDAQFKQYETYKHQAKMQQQAMMAKAQAPRKAIPAAEMRQRKEFDQSIVEGVRLARRLEDFTSSGGKITPISSNKVAIWLGVGDEEAGALDAKLMSMFRRLGRAAGVDVGNLALKEGEILVQSGTGRAWSTQEESLRTLKEVILKAMQMRKAEIEGLGHHYDVSALGPLTSELERTVTGQ